MSKEPRIPIIEIFGPTIQGEGIMSGTVTHFLRTGGCGLKCVWCDSMHAVDPQQIRKNRTMMTIDELIKKISSMPYAPYITFTGGDPCLQKHLGLLIPWLNSKGIRVAIETQGQLFPEWLKDCDVITFSPKGPSSGNVVDYHDLIEWINETFPRPNLRPCRICIKVVVFNKEDLEYALQVYDAMSIRQYDAFYFTAGTPLLDVDEPVKYDDGTVHAPSPEVRDARAMHRMFGVISSQTQLANSILDISKVKHFNERTHIGCQQHVLLWPDKDKGV